MNCRGVSRRLSAYIDDELSPGIRESMAEHLGICASCARKHADLQAISEAARNLPPLEVSEGFKERVLASSRSGQEKIGIFYGFRSKAVLAGMAFVATAAAVFFVVGPQSSSIIPAIPGPEASAEAPHSGGEPSATLDFVDDPTVKIESFPVPEGARVGDLTKEDSLLLADSTSKTDEFILPVMEKTKENVNIKF